MKKYRVRKREKIKNADELTFSSYFDAIKMNDPFRLPAVRILHQSGGITVSSANIDTATAPGGIIVFPAGFTGISADDIIKTTDLFIAGLFPGERIYYSEGDYFRGNYTDRKTGYIFNSSCLTIELTGLPDSHLVPAAEKIAFNAGLIRLMVNEIRSGRRYLVNGL